MNDYKVVETDTIKVNYYQLPITNLYKEFIVEVLQPMPTVPVVKKITYSSFTQDPKEVLKELLLNEWHEVIGMATDVPQWMKDINKVELIECDLLTPKKG